MLNGSVSSFFILPGVVEYLSNGGVADNHKDFKELRYNVLWTSAAMGRMEAQKENHTWLPTEERLWK